MIATVPLRVFVVDDEAPARKKLLHFLGRESGIIVVGESNNGADAVRKIVSTRPDLLFLDVQMPGINGFDVVRALAKDSLPQIVFVTAHDEYAIQAFDVHAFGYLLKPFDQIRFAKILADARQHLSGNLATEANNRLQKLLAEIQRREQGSTKLLVQQNDRGFLLSLDKIDWAESERNYLKLHVGNQTYTVRGTIEKLQEKLAASHFLRLNRSCIVRVDFIQELQKWSHGEYRVMLLSAEVLTWTRRYLDGHPELLERF